MFEPPLRGKAAFLTGAVSLTSMSSFQGNSSSGRPAAPLMETACLFTRGDDCPESSGAGLLRSSILPASSGSDAVATAAGMGGIIGDVKRTTSPSSTCASASCKRAVKKRQRLSESWSGPWWAVEACEVEMRRSLSRWEVDVKSKESSRDASKLSLAAWACMVALQPTFVRSSMLISMLRNNDTGTSAAAICCQ